MKAIAIQQPWAQLVISGCKKFMLADSFPFKEGETVLIYATDFDPQADEDGCLLSPCNRLMLENARVFGYLTEDELPTNAFIGCVQVMHYNVGEDVSSFSCYLPEHLYIGDKNGPAEIQFVNPQAFTEPIYDEVNPSETFFECQLSATHLPETFTYQQFTLLPFKIFAPCSMQFFFDIEGMDEYVYSVNLLPELQRELDRVMNATPFIPSKALKGLTTLEKQHKVKFVTFPHDITFVAGNLRVTFIIKSLDFEPSVVEPKTKVAVFHLSKVNNNG